MMDYTNWPVIGEGFERICYQDPANPVRCIKIIRKAHYKQTQREIVYFRYLVRRGIPFDHLPKFYGEIRGSHNKLIGIEQELIYDIPLSSADTVKKQNTSIRPSKTIRQYLSETLSAQQISEFLKALDTLKCYLLRYNILALDINHNNIVVQNTGNGIRLVLIDGVYNTEWLPISQYFRFFGSRKILRRWNRFISALHEIYPQLDHIQS